MENNIKGKVKAYYGGIAKKVSAESKTSCGCGTSCCGDAPNNSNLYTKEFIEGLPEEVIEEIAKQKNLGDVYSKMDAELIDGAFAGAHVKAYKL
jgi:hypothetical protein